jgi:hypothetical protein
MQPEIFLYNKGDVLVFSSVAKALDFVEPIDIINNEYEAFDKNGHTLNLKINERGIIELLRSSQHVANDERLKKILINVLMFTGLERETLEQQSLEGLVEKMRIHLIQ